MSQMTILNATWGGADVTNTVQGKVKNGRLLVKASTSVFGDPQVGVKKILEVISDIDAWAVEEGKWMMLPKSNTNRLGVWYSNNNQPDTVRESLMNLTRFNGKADILTSVWEPIKDNPFPEFVNQYRVASHLTIGLQVLSLLYVAREVGQYDWVSFLEHDVLYPDDYFDDKVIASNGIQVVCNMNYHGICKDGFQKMKGRVHPLHQMTMRFDFAVSHWERFVLGCVQSGGGGIVEPSVSPLEHRTVGKAIHVNHKRNFTSHFATYSDDLYPYDEDWGNAEELIKKLNIS